MKKIIVWAAVLLLAGGLYAENNMRFGLNFGVVTDDSFSFKPFMWTAGAELDFHLGDYLMLSPEITMVNHKFEFKQFVLYPGAVLNLTFGQLFLGGGLVKGIYIGDGTSFVADKFSLKLNGGFIGDSYKLTAYLITEFDDLFKKGMVVGATLGFRF